MYDYSSQIDKFHDDKVRLSEDFKGELLNHRKSNRDRLIGRISDHIKTVVAFHPQ